MRFASQNEQCMSDRRQTTVNQQLLISDTDLKFHLIVTEQLNLHSHNRPFQLVQNNNSLQLSIIRSHPGDWVPINITHDTICHLQLNFTIDAYTEYECMNNKHSINFKKIRTTVKQARHFNERHLCTIVTVTIWTCSHRQLRWITIKEYNTNVANLARAEIIFSCSSSVNSRFGTLTHPRSRSCQCKTSNCYIN